MVSVRKHHYEAIEKAVDKIKNLMGPILQIERQHHFTEIADRAEKMLHLFGPAYEVERKNHFVAIQTHVDLAKRL